MDGRTEGNKRMGGKFTRVPNEIFELGRYLTVKAKFVYIALCSFRNNTTGATFPSYAKIKERSGLKRNEDVSKAITELEQFGWLEKNRRFNQSTDYKLGIPIRELPTQEEDAKWKKVVSRMRSAEFIEELEKAKAAKTERKSDIDNSEDEIPF